MVDGAKNTGSGKITEIVLYYINISPCMLTLQSCPTLCDPMGCSPPGSLSMGYPRQEYWRALLFSSPGDLPNPGMEPESLRSPPLAGGFFTTSSTWEPNIVYISCQLFLWRTQSNTICAFYVLFKKFSSILKS